MSFTPIIANGVHRFWRKKWSDI